MLKYLLICGASCFIAALVCVFVAAAMPQYPEMVIEHLQNATRWAGFGIIIIMIFILTLVYQGKISDD